MYKLDGSFFVSKFIGLDWELLSNRVSVMISHPCVACPAILVCVTIYQNTGIVLYMPTHLVEN